MKHYALFSAWLLLTIQTADAQKEQLATFLPGQLPNNITPDKSVTRSYRMTTDYYDHDLTGNFRAKRRLTGAVTYEGDSARWRDVYYAESEASDGEFPQGEMQVHMQDFCYRPGEETLAAGFFEKRLPQADPHVMNMVWDALAFETLTHGCWDSLKLNETFRARNIDSELEIAIGNFENKNTEITWIGITRINGRTCAILKYTVMNNPLNVEYENIFMRGRSHYWGEIYVSLADKQIEQAILTEDVLTDVKMKDRETNVIGYTTRSISLSRMR